MKFVSWNVNGLRACMNKGFADFFNDINADIFAIQETKMQEEQKVSPLTAIKRFGTAPRKKDIRAR